MNFGTSWFRVELSHSGIEVYDLRDWLYGVLNIGFSCDVAMSQLGGTLDRILMFDCGSQ
jgi:hypothetical protein